MSILTEVCAKFSSYIYTKQLNATIEPGYRCSSSAIFKRYIGGPVERFTKVFPKGFTVIYVECKFDIKAESDFKIIGSLTVENYISTNNRNFEVLDK